MPVSLGRRRRVTDNPSEVVVHQRIRNRIIEYLDAASRPETWPLTFGIAAELVNQWEDWVLPAWLPHYGPPVFSAAELDAIHEFSTAWDRAADSIFREGVALDTVINCDQSRQFALAAGAALAVFMRRGKLSEDREISS